MLRGPARTAGRAAYCPAYMACARHAALHETLFRVAGYSGTPLPKKLGIKPGSRLALVGAPDGFDERSASCRSASSSAPATRGPLDVIVFFTTSRRSCGAASTRLAGALDPAGALWVAWPKKQLGRRRPT